MRTNQIQGIINDLIHLGEDFNPLIWVWIKEKFDFNLIGKKNFGKDSLAEFYEMKKNWFINRVKKLKGNIDDFQKAKIHVFGKKEKIEIVYKNKEFSNEKIYGLDNNTKEFLKEMRRQKKENAGLI
jgi:hypothetical protein